MTAAVLRCPVCGGRLERRLADGRLAGLACAANHTFDAAKEGYVNLLTGKRNSKDPGDNKLMVEARRTFLGAGYYAPFRDCAAGMVKERGPDLPLLLDVGCGEGYYTETFAQLGGLCGIDISRTAVRMAGKRLKAAFPARIADGSIALCAASAMALPAEDGQFDFVVNLFSPLDAGEVRRVLKVGGRFLYAVPAPEHLMELKRVLYDRPYPNGEHTDAYDGFALEERRRVRAELLLPKEHILPLFAMTPYYYRTPPEGARRLSALDSLDVTAEIDFLVYRREG